MFLFNEDEALVAKLSGLVVQDTNQPADGRPVQVIWALPDDDFVALTYPCIRIQNNGLSFDETRAASGWFQLPYTPEGFPQWIENSPADVTTSPYWAFTPTPYSIDYQIQVMSRNNQHATFLAAVLAGPDYLSERHGYLVVGPDSTIRRLDILSGPERESMKDNDGKRLFVSTYLIRVSTELLPQQIYSYNKVEEVDIDLSVLPS